MADLANVGLSAVSYQSSHSGGWHLYLPFDYWESSNEVEQTLKHWLSALGYCIAGGTLEVFPSGNALRLPLQPGFGWIAPDGSLIKDRDQITVEDALASFLFDLKHNARNWFDAKQRIDSQIAAIVQSTREKVQEHKEHLNLEGFEHLYSAGKIQEVWEKGRKWWSLGLQSNGERHEAVLAVGHYLWYGDEDRYVSALPGDINAEYRAMLIEAWLKENHNGKCRHINQGNWRVVNDQIHRAVFWRRNKEHWVREPYPLTSRLLKRLVALYKTTKRIWSIEQFEKANQDRKLEARARIAEAIVSLKEEGLLITIAEVARKAKAHWTTVKKNWDLMAVVLVPTVEENQTSQTEANLDLLTRSAGVINPGGGDFPELVAVEAVTSASGSVQKIPLFQTAVTGFSPRLKTISLISAEILPIRPASYSLLVRPPPL